MNMAKKILVVALGFAVGVLTMPVWPFLTAAMAWNESDDDYEEED